MAKKTSIAPTQKSTPSPAKSKTRKIRRRWWRFGLVVILVLLVGACIGRAMMPSLVRKYVNRTLEASPLYSGEIGGVRIHLWRGAYSIQDVRINKRIDSAPVPFFKVKNLDLSVQWKALWHGRIVSTVLMEEPEMNFVDMPSQDKGQTGEGGPWLDMLQQLFPFRINHAQVQNGSVHFRLFQSKTPVDVFLSNLRISIDNLSNVRDDSAPLFSTVEASALAMDQARVECKILLDPFSYRPTFHMTARLLGLDVTTLNDLAQAYGKFDFEHGWFDFVVEADAESGRLTGYAKPLFRDLQIFSLAGDNDNPLQLFWQALVGSATSLLKNPPRDQFGTLIPFTGDLSGSTSANLLATLGNVLHNAFVRAYLPRLEQENSGLPFLNFGVPKFTDSLAVGGAN